MEHFTVLKNFVVFEGIDGSGTSSQIEILKSRLGECLFTAEPTDGQIGVLIREILSGKKSVSSRALALLFAADRAEHIWGKGGVEEASGSGRLVISNRYFFSSLAYQGLSVDEAFLREINGGLPLPERLFFFDIRPEISMQRIERRGEQKEIFEEEATLARIADRYRKIIAEAERAHPQMQVVTLDASLPKEKIAEEILSKLPARNRQD